MAIWKQTALELLESSLNPIPSEKNRLDWKQGLSTNTDRLAEHISAFSNTEGGGWLVIGITDKGEVTGVAPEEVKHIVDRLGNIARQNVQPSVTIEHCVTEYKGVNLLLLLIKESNHKPVHVRGRGLEHSYIRSAGQTRKVEPHELRVLVRSGDNDFFEERFVMQGLEVDEIEKFLDVNVFYALTEAKRPKAIEAIQADLEKHNLLAALPNGIAITNLGAMVLAKDLEVPAFRELKRKSVRVVFYDGRNRVHAKKEISGAKGYAVGFEGLISYLKDNLSEEVITTLRKTTYKYPEEALRELAANAIIHQDFTIRGQSPMIEVFDDRIEITNPGTPLIDPLRFLDFPPRSRNEKLAAIMKKFHICEERGSGIDRVIQAIESHQLPGPQFARGENFTRAIIYAHKELKNMSKEEKVRTCYWHACLRQESNLLTDNASIRERFGIKSSNYPMASKILADTVEAGLIRVAELLSNSKRDVKYIPYWAGKDYVTELTK